MYNSDWVAYKIHITRSDLEENFREDQIIENGHLKRQQENLKNICRVLDTRKSLLRDKESIVPKIQAEENFTQKLLTFGDKTSRDRKNTHLIMKRASFEQDPDSKTVFRNYNNVNKNGVHDKLEDKAIEKTQESKESSIDEDEIKCTCQTLEQQLHCVSNKLSKVQSYITSDHFKDQLTNIKVIEPETHDKTTPKIPLEPRKMDNRVIRKHDHLTSTSDTRKKTFNLCGKHIKPTLFDNMATNSSKTEMSGIKITVKSKHKKPGLYNETIKTLPSKNLKKPVRGKQEKSSNGSICTCCTLGSKNVKRTICKEGVKPQLSNESMTSTSASEIIILVKRKHKKPKYNEMINDKTFTTKERHSKDFELSEKTNIKLLDKENLVNRKHKEQIKIDEICKKPKLLEKTKTKLLDKENLVDKKHKEQMEFSPSDFGPNKRKCDLTIDTHEVNRKHKDQMRINDISKKSDLPEKKYTKLLNKENVVNNKHKKETRINDISKNYELSEKRCTTLLDKENLVNRKIKEQLRINETSKRSKLFEKPKTKLLDKKNKDLTIDTREEEESVSDVKEDDDNSFDNLPSDQLAQCGAAKQVAKPFKHTKFKVPWSCRSWLNSHLQRCREYHEFTELNTRHQRSLQQNCPNPFGCSLQSPICSWDRPTPKMPCLWPKAQYCSDDYIKSCTPKFLQDTKTSPTFFQVLCGTIAVCFCLPCLILYSLFHVRGCCKF